MSALRRENFEDRLPDKVEIQNAEQLLKIIASQADETGQVSLNLTNEEGELNPITLTAGISDALLQVLRLVASGRSFTLVPVGAELSTKQAADHLNVSRPYLIKLLENGDIPHRKVGRHRRVLAEDLFAYQAKRNELRKAALDDLLDDDIEEISEG